MSLQGIVAVQAVLEFQPAYQKGLTIALYIGMLVGALFWGFFADIMGRRIAFNISLFICSIFTIVAGASPDWGSLGFFIAMAAFGAGGNLILDTAVFLEFLPSNKQWVSSSLAAWWGVGCTIAGLVAWGFMRESSLFNLRLCENVKYVFGCMLTVDIANYSCESADSCTRANNSGWRYQLYTMGALIFAMSVARVTVIRLRETPKFLLGQGKDDEVVANLSELAGRYGRNCSLTIEQLEACGVVKNAHAPKRFSFAEFSVHVRSLFLNKKLGFTTVLIWLSWTMIGLAYPLFNVFLPYYLASRGIQFGVTSTYETWRNYALVQVSGTFGPILGGLMANTKWFGRRYTMIIGALVTMAFFFAYARVSSQAANIAYSCVISFNLEIYYGVLYGYTAETLPSAHRGTGDGIAVAFCRFAGAMSAVVATYADPSTTSPVFVCAALYGGLAVCAFLLPFEPYGKRAA